MVKKKDNWKAILSFGNEREKKNHFHLLVHEGHPDLIQKDEKTVSIYFFHLVVQRSFRFVYYIGISYSRRDAN